ncbi:hypothetical protein AB3S75_047727 [Citrus x aurantiifolia]
MGANSIQGQSDSEQCIAERKMVSDLSNRIDDLKVDLEWYKKVSWLKSKSYYDSFTNSLGGAGKPLSSPVVLADTEHRQVKTVNSFLAETPESTEAMVNAKEAALKIRACKLEQGYNYSSSLISICQIVDQHPLFIRLVMAFNSIAFFLSMALLMILFNELPLRPLLLVSACSMLGAYICAITDLTEPT